MSDTERPKKKFFVYEDPDEIRFEESRCGDEAPAEGEVRRFKKKERPDRAVKMAALFQKILEDNNKSTDNMGAACFKSEKAENTSSGNTNSDSGEDGSKKKK